MLREVERTEGTLILAAGPVLGGLGVVAGAFGAHLLKARLDPDAMDVWRTAAQYQMIHAVALLLIGRQYTRQPSRFLRAACWLFITGIGVFSGSLYLLALTGAVTVGAITPMGGLLLLAGWTSLALGVLRSGRD